MRVDVRTEDQEKPSFARTSCGPMLTQTCKPVHMAQGEDTRKHTSQTGCVGEESRYLFHIVLIQ